MTERQFSDDEVAAIFKEASELENLAATSSGKGMTLAALQEIGREAGMSPEAIERAALALDRAAPAQAQVQTFLALPVAVARTVEVDRPFAESEWERLVADLRVTFNARGVIMQEGAFRQWTNGNLQALIEPTPSGFRLRLKTMNANARALMTIGMGGVALSVASSIAMAMAGTLTNAGSVIGPAFLAVTGVGLFGIGAFQLPGWARRRKTQMQEVSARTASPMQLPTKSTDSARIPD